jgi:hypothetical protein
MKKLTLDLDAMNVESFTTMPEEGANGTVMGYITAWSECGGAYCTFDGCPDFSRTPQCNTAAVTCDYGPTMNPIDAECNANTMAGNTCQGGDTCYNTCGQ